MSGWTKFLVFVVIGMSLSQSVWSSTYLPHYIGRNFAEPNHVSAQLEARPYRSSADRTAFAQLNIRGTHNLMENFEVYGTLPVYYAAAGSNDAGGVGNFTLGFYSFASFLSPTEVWDISLGIGVDVNVPTSNDSNGIAKLFGANPYFGLIATREQMTLRMSLEYGGQVGIGDASFDSVQQFGADIGVSVHITPKWKTHLEYSFYSQKFTGTAGGEIKLTPQLATASVSGQFEPYWGSLFLQVPVDSDTRREYVIGGGFRVGYAF